MQQQLPFSEAEGQHAERIAMAAARLAAGPAPIRLATLEAAVRAARLEVRVLALRVYCETGTGLGEVPLSYEQIASEGFWSLGSSRQSARRTIREAVALGVVDLRERLDGTGSQRPNLYWIPWRAIVARYGTSVPAMDGWWAGQLGGYQIGAPPVQIDTPGVQIDTPGVQIDTPVLPVRPVGQASGEEFTGPRAVACSIDSARERALARARALSVSVSGLSSTTSETETETGTTREASFADLGRLTRQALAVSYGSTVEGHVTKNEQARRAVASVAILAECVFFDRQWLLLSAEETHHAVRTIQPRPPVPWRYLLGVLANKCVERLGVEPFVDRHQRRQWFAMLTSAVEPHVPRVLAAMPEPMAAEELQPAGPAYDTPADPAALAAWEQKLNQQRERVRAEGRSGTGGQK